MAESSNDLANAEPEYVIVGIAGKVAPNGKPAPADQKCFLPDRWEEVQTSDGTPYFLDHETKTSTWAKPDGNLSSEAHPSRPGTSGKEALPPGWEVKVVAQSNRTYYVDHNTRTTTWVRPVPDNEETFRPLPMGWERRTTEDSRARLYFVNHNNKTTSWYHPCHLTEGTQEAGLPAANSEATAADQDAKSRQTVTITQ